MYSRRWLIAAVVACVLVSACSQFNTNLSVQTSSSSVSFVSPQTETAGATQDLPITVNGAGFVTGAFVLWNGAQLTNTTYVSTSQLTATVPAADLAAPGTVQVAVQIPGSAVSGTTNLNNGATNASNTTEVSNIVNFTITPAAGPLPTITSISAPSTSMAATPYCQPNGFTLTVNGTNLVTGSVVNWNSPANGSATGSARATQFVSSTQLTATIMPTDVAFLDTVGVSVSTPSGTSGSKLFTLTTPSSLPAPVISSISQSLAALTPPVGTATSVPAHSPTFTLTVNGSSFVPCSVVQWGGNAQTTTYVGANQVTATIPSGLVFSSGSVNVTVFTLTPGGGTSAPIVFTITP
jgi:hypothetical protein